MSLRGRGTLETKPTNSPFFQTTSQSFGVDPYSRPEYDHHKIYTPEQNNQITRYNNRKKNTDEIDDKMLSFLYSRESDRIGSKPNNLVNLKSKMEEDMRNRQERLQEEQDEEDRILYEESMMKTEQKTILTPEEVLKHYKHVPKAEHPLYITAAVCIHLLHIIHIIRIFISSE